MFTTKTIVKLAYYFLQWQIRSLFYALDPLAKYEPNPLVSFQQIHRTDHRFYSSPFFVPLLLYIACDLYGNVYLVYKWQTQKADDQNHRGFTLSAFKDCPVMMNHQVFPKVIHAQADTALAIGTLSSMLAIGVFINTPILFLDRYSLIKKKNAMILNIKGKSEKKFCVL